MKADAHRRQRTLSSFSRLDPLWSAIGPTLSMHKSSTRGWGREGCVCFGREGIYNNNINNVGYRRLHTVGCTSPFGVLYAFITLQKVSSGQGRKRHHGSLARYSRIKSSSRLYPTAPVAVLGRLVRRPCPALDLVLVVSFCVLSPISDIVDVVVVVSD